MESNFIVYMVICALISVPLCKSWLYCVDHLYTAEIVFYIGVLLGICVLCNPFTFVWLILCSVWNN